MDKKLYEEIKYNEKLITIILWSNYTSDKIVFFSPPDFSQQLGYLPNKRGNIIKSHIHKKIDRKVECANARSKTSKSESPEKSDFS